MHHIAFFWVCSENGVIFYTTTYVVLNVQRQPSLFQDANGIIPHLHGSTDPAGTFQRQMEAHGFQVVACEASSGEYDFGNDANSLVAELRAMGGPFSGSFIRYRVRVLGCVNSSPNSVLNLCTEETVCILVPQRRGEGRLLA